MKQKPDTKNNLTAFMAANADDPAESAEPEIAAPPVVAPAPVALPPLQPSPPPLRQAPNMQRRTIAVPGHLLQRFDDLYARWLYERREVRKEQMWTTMLDDYLNKYGG